MYDLDGRKRPGATRQHKTGFVAAEPERVDQVRLLRPQRRRHLLLLEVPDQRRRLRRRLRDGAEDDHARSQQRQRHQRLDAAAGDLPRLRSRRPRAGARRRSRAEACATVNPFGIPPQGYEKAFQGSLSTVGQARTTSPWGTLDQGGNVVEWTDTITASPTGKSDGRVWRRLHGGIANAPAYQLWLSAVGLQPEDNAAFTATYPWLGFRIGVLGNLKAGQVIETGRPRGGLGSPRVPRSLSTRRFAAGSPLALVARRRPGAAGRRARRPRRRRGER